MHRLIPKSVICFREGYSVRQFAGELGAGLTVAIIALPLAMALGIASIPREVSDQLARDYGPWLTPPAMGLFTAVIAGFIISAFGGSRVQVGGPTAAFIPIVFGIAATHGYAGLATATAMAGVIVILMGVFRFGAMIKYIPYPVTTGFTTGIAVTIIVSQIKDFLGLSVLDSEGRPASLPAEFVPKLLVLWENAGTISWQSTSVAAGSLAVLVVLRRLIPRVPGAIVAVVGASAFVWLTGWSEAVDQAGRPLVATIGSRFGGIPNTLPVPHLPPFSFQLMREMIPAATTIAMLCAIESLLSAVVADGMTGRRHKSDCELVAQGAANIASACFFGIPATGAIARTVANIKNGGKTPVAGMLHAVILLVFMLVAAPAAKLIPIGTLSAVLVIVAWNISELDHFNRLLRAPRSDVLVLLTTFGLTVFTDLTIAVGVGMVLAAMLFMKRMADVSGVQAITRDFAGTDEELDETVSDLKDPTSVARTDVPPGVEIYEIAGPFFFGVADRLKDTLGQFERPPKVFILRMRKVPAIDATGLHALREFHARCQRDGTRLLLSGVHAQPLFAITQAGFDRVVGIENMFETLHDSLTAARAHIALSSGERSAAAAE